MSGEAKLELAEYFRQRLHDVGKHFPTPPQEDTLWYVGDMLARFGYSDQLYSYNNGDIEIRPLAILYKDAHETNDHRHRCLILRHLGDLALFIGSLFPESYRRRGLEHDYFVGMGGSAYSYLSENSIHNRHIFAELAARFSRLTALIAKACAAQEHYDNTDILNLYQRWEKSADPAIARQLQNLGVRLPESKYLH